LPAFRLVTLAGLAASNAEARRLIRGGGVRVNDAIVSDEAQPFPAGQLAEGLKLSVGRKHHRLVRAE